MNRAAYREWFATRPPAIKAMIGKFPLRSKIEVRGESLFVFGYNEGDMLILTPLDPAVDYDAAMAARIYLCADHVRHGECAHEHH